MNTLASIVETSCENYRSSAHCPNALVPPVFYQLFPAKSQAIHSDFVHPGSLNESFEAPDPIDLYQPSDLSPQ